MKIIGKSWLTLLVCLVPAIVLAQGLKEAGGKLGSLQNEVGLSGSFEGVTATVVTLALSLVGTIFFVLMIYGGFVWIKSAGREEEITRGKKIVITSIIGLAVALSSYAIANFVLNRLASQPAAGGSGYSCMEWGGTCVSTADACDELGAEGGTVATYECPSGNPVCCVPK